MRRRAVQVRGELLAVAVEHREKEKYTPNEELCFVSGAFTPSEPEMPNSYYITFILHTTL